MKLSLIHESDPRLTQVSEELTDWNYDDVSKFTEQMWRIMTDTNGIAIAAPQLGWMKRVIVLSFAPHIMINPVIVSAYGDVKSMTEGCLSFPDLQLDVERPSIVDVTYTSIFGDEVSTTFKDLEAVVIQHEVDHLNGIVFTSKVSSLKLNVAKRARKKYQRRSK